MKKVLVVMLVLVLCISCVACSNNANEKQNNEKEQNNAKSNDSGNNNNGENSSEVVETVEIELFQVRREGVEAFDEMIATFEANQEGVKVQQNNVPEAQQVLMTRLASGDIPDVISYWPDQPDFKAWVDEGHILDISNEPFLENITPEILALSSYKGKDYALPLSLNTMGVFYHVDQFEDLGLTVPKTYDELIQMLDSIKEMGKTPLMLPDKDGWTIGQHSCLLMGMMMDMEEVYSGLATGDIHASDVEGYRKQAEVLVKMREYSQKDALGTSYDQAINEFANGKSVMFIQGIWAIAPILSANPDVNIKMFPFPAEKEEDTKTTASVDCALAIMADTDKLEAAKTFMSFAGTAEGGQIYTNYDNQPSAINGVVLETDIYKPLVELINQGKCYNWAWGYWAPGIMGEYFSDVQQLVIDFDVDDYLDRQDDLFKVE